tara:strand:+ start:670 stop:780 length:111 start_codon:yes stop_codon:yes gene_type:complete
MRYQDPSTLVSLGGGAKCLMNIKEIDEVSMDGGYEI